MKKAFFSIKTAVMLAALVGLPIMSYAQVEGEGTTVVGTGVNGVAVGTSTSSQDVTLRVDGSALIQVVNSKGGSAGISMSLTGATQAGAAILDQTTNNDTRLRLSSLVEDGMTRTITASIAPSLEGTDTQLFVTVANPTDPVIQPIPSNGGTSAGEKELTNATTEAALLVTGIKTCWTGRENLTDGYIVTYRYAKKANATALRSENVVITYTITAEVGS